MRWHKPPRQQKPGWIGLRQYLSLPATLTLRELRYRLAAKGQRTRQVTIVTTLLDPLLYPKEKIAQLYGIRWRTLMCGERKRAALRLGPGCSE